MHILFFAIFLYGNFYCCYNAVALPKAEPLIGGFKSMNFQNSIYCIQEDFISTLWNSHKFIEPTRCTGSFISPTILISAGHCL